jgi:DNA-directed RNA polymerase specialized sigma24 family protein
LTPSIVIFEKVELMDRAPLNLVDSKGIPVDPVIQTAVQTAFRWVVRAYPRVDQAKLADWAEEVAAAMDVRGSVIASPKRYASAALNGKVRDWLRTSTAREVSYGIGPDLERIGGASKSFEDVLERKILLDELKKMLNERDQMILVLLLADKSTSDVAQALDTNYTNAAKAIQRMKDRISAKVNGTRTTQKPGSGPALYCETKR